MSFSKRMWIVSVALAMALCTGISFSCIKTSCSNTICVNGGICNAGKCTCATGFEGDNCATPSRQKFLGYWYLPDTGIITRAAQTPVQIVAGALITDIFIENINNIITQPVSAYISGSDSLYIPTQVVLGYTITGTGFFVNDTEILAHYVMTDTTGHANSVNAVWQ